MLWILGIVVAIMIDWVIARQFADIAERKGYEGSTYFWFTFLFGIAGMLMVVALPERSSGVSLPKQPADLLRKAAENTQRDTTKRCPHCGELVRGDICEMCGKEVN